MDLGPKRKDESWQQFVARTDPILKSMFNSYVEIRQVQWGTEEDDIHEYIAYDENHPKFKAEEELMRKVAKRLNLAINDIEDDF